MQLNPYLTFNGNCEEAMNFYADVLGGEISMMMRFSEAPNGSSFPKEIHNKIMHCTLECNGIIIMGSDNTGQMPFNQGNNYHLSLNIKSEDEAYAIYKSLAEGGKELMPFQEVFWGGKFGMLVDKFGVQWMVSSEHK